MNFSVLRDELEIAYKELENKYKNLEEKCSVLMHLQSNHPKDILAGINFIVLYKLNLKNIIYNKFFMRHIKCIIN